MDIRSRTSFRGGLPAALTLALVAASCGGGGGGGPADKVSLAGTLTVPAFSSSLGEGAPRDGSVYDDDAFHARRLGAVDHARAAVDAGRVGPGATDPLDVLRFELPTGAWELQVEGDDGLDVRVFDVRSGEQLRAVGARTRTTFRVEGEEPEDVDVALASFDAVRAWRLQWRRLEVADIAAEAALPLSAAADVVGPRSRVQAHYLGAVHEMMPGEVVVLREESAVDGSFAALPAVALEGELQLVRAPETSPLAVFRVPVTPETLNGAVAGVSAEVALGLEAALTAKRLERLPGIAAASPNYVRSIQTTPDDQFFSFQWHFQILGMEAAWDVTTGSNQTYVGVVDTGIVSMHPDFSGRIEAAGYDFISDTSISLDGDGIDPNPEDPGDQSQGPQGSSWHGSHVGGTIAANGNDGLGVAGMDWACRLVPLRALGFGGRGSLADITEAVRYAAGLSNASGTTPNVPKGRVDVLNLSLGGGGGSAVEQQVYDQARAAGMLAVCAAGNDGTSTPQYPASFPSTLSVGSIRFDLRRAPYSNFASTVDVYAPGGDMTVDQSGDGNPDGVLSVIGPFDGQTARWSFSQGTSMACPHAAGLASLVYALLPNATPTDVENLIIDNARDLGAGLANGMIDPLPTLQAAQGGGGGGGAPALAVSPPNFSFGTMQTSTSLTLRNTGGGRVSIDVAARSIAYVPQVSGWLDARPVPTSDPSISHSALLLTVDRGVLPVGSYQAEITLALVGGGSHVIPVSVDVDAVSTENVFVLLVEPVELTTVAQAVTNEAANWRWTWSGSGESRPVSGEYLVVAGTDRDDDDFIGDAGEIFGLWPFSDDPGLLAVPEGALIRQDLDFSLYPTDSISQRVGRMFRRLR